MKKKRDKYAISGEDETEYTLFLDCLPESREAKYAQEVIKARNQWVTRKIKGAAAETVKKLFAPVAHE